MPTAELRDLVSEAATRMGGRLWPNRLGFDYRGWVIAFSEYYNTWVAYRDNDDDGPSGNGDTAEEALENVRRKRRAWQAEVAHGGTW